MNPTQHPDAKFYERYGVTPPTREMHGTEQGIAEALKEKVKHGRWIQSGNMITCRTCPMEHSHPIPMDHILTGTDENGLPTFKKLDIPKA